MEKKVLDFIRQYHILDGVSRIVIGVSGGADSVALAHFVVNRFPEYEYIIAHLNHGLREEAEEEETFVCSFAEKLGVDVRSCRKDIAALAKERKQGIEETGREERYRFFRSLGADLILTAHHKDDQAETVLLHLLRGCGLSGLCGMEPRGGDLARPFLCVTKEEILSYCERNGLAYKNDLSNEDTVYTRNRVRKELIPLMEEINPNITESLWRLSQNAVADACFLDDCATEEYRRSRYKKDDILCLKISADLKADLAVVRRMIRMAAEECGVCADFDHTERVIALTNGKRMPLSDEVWVCRYADHYTFGPPPKKAALAEGAALSVDGTVVFGDHIIESKRRSEQVKGNIDSLGVFDLTLFDTAPVIRTRRNGDYVVLPNGQKKKLSDYFIDEKVPSSERDVILLLAVDDRVLWVVGHRFFASKGQENLIVNISVKS